MLENKMGRTDIIEKMSTIVSGGKSGSIRKSKVLRKETQAIEIQKTKALFDQFDPLIVSLNCHVCSASCVTVNC